MRLLIVDDQLAVAEALALAFIRVNVSTAILHNPADVLPWLQENVVDSLLLDDTLPHHDVFSLIRQIHSRHPSLAIIVLSMFSVQAEWPVLRRSGSRGAVSKTLSLAELVPNVLELASGRREVYTPKIAPRPGVTPRQLDFLMCSARGLSHKEIAKELGIHKDRVDDLSIEVTRRLGARSGSQVILRAVEEGLIEPRVPPRFPT